MEGSPDDLDDALAAALGPVMGPVRIEHLRLLSGGASRQTWSFDAVADGSAPGGADRRGLVLQRTRGGLSGMRGPSMEVEDDLLVAAAAAGVPVPALVLGCRDAPPSLLSDGEGHARVVERVDGETLGARIVRDERYADARRGLAEACGRALAGIHSIDPAAVGGLAEIEPLRRLQDGFDLLGEARPAFQLALRWLEEHRPPARPPRIVHGDFRIGNLVVDDHGLRAVLDWELAHLGDPVEDLGWLCVRSWRFGGEGAVGGVGELDDLLRGYTEAGGAEVGPDELRWWMLVGTLTWGLICAVQARRHLDGHVRSVELAAIGRRICETEYDALRLLDLLDTDTDTAAGIHDERAGGGAGGVVGPEPTPPEPPPGLHGRPTAAELVEAVRDHLVDHVAPRLEGSAAFHLKVAANALGIVQRELRERPGAANQLATLMSVLEVDDEAELSARIRSGELGGPVVSVTVREAVLQRLRVANPRWIEPPDR